MKLLTFLLCFTIFSSHAIDLREDLGAKYNYKLDSVTDASADKYVTIHIKIIDVEKKAIANAGVSWRYDDVKGYKKLQADNNGMAELKIMPGRLSIFASKSAYPDGHTPFLMFNKDMTYTLTLILDGAMMFTRKPVIYLYPEEITAFQLIAQPTGDLFFTYPGETANWKGTAQPTGQLEIEDKAYDYLFWEAQQNVKDLLPYMITGTLCDKSEVLSFLERSLVQLGLNNREMQDFISYWAPEMMGHNRVQITFLINDDYEAISTNTISPKPDTEIRIYMAYKPVDRFAEVTKQVLPNLERNGFTLVEWGGCALPEDLPKL